MEIYNINQLTACGNICQVVFFPLSFKGIDILITSLNPRWAYSVCPTLQTYCVFFFCVTTLNFISGVLISVGTFHCSWRNALYVSNRRGSKISQPQSINNNFISCLQYTSALWHFDEYGLLFVWAFYTPTLCVRIDTFDWSCIITVITRLSSE